VSSLLHPVGPQPPGVYWFRRALLMAAVLGIVSVVLWLTWGGTQAEGAAGAETSAARSAPDEQQPRAAATAAPSADAAGDSAAERAGDAEPAATSPSASATPEVTACAAPGLSVGVATDADSYGADAVPRLSVTIRNGGSTACTVDVGSPDAVEILVTSGDDRIWSSNDCQPAAKPSVVTLAPEAEEVLTVSWQRGRSAEGCPTGLSEPRPGTYQVTARAGKVSSTPETFVLR
jgi:hypothetical protein